jgi:hypothetical protein
MHGSDEEVKTVLNVPEVSVLSTGTVITSQIINSVRINDQVSRNTRDRTFRWVSYLFCRL